MNTTLNRKEFIKKTALTGAGISLMPFSIIKGKSNGKVRLGFIGVGARGTSQVRVMVQRPDIEIPAICDIDEESAKNAASLVTGAGLEGPELYTNDEYDYRRMLERDDLDGVLISTPWLWHVPMAVETMESGKYAGVEVPAATTVDGCWDLVETSERTGMPCMIMENACYRRDVMAVLNIVRQGLFGEMMHARCGYQHSVPNLLDENGNFGPGTGRKSSWRTVHYKNRNADLYPTHGIGPVAHWMDINRGNRFVNISSTATKSRGMHNQVVEIAGEDHPNADIEFKLGDVVTSMITTSNGETIVVTHDTSMPRPYSLGFRCQGTKGQWMVDNNSIYIHGVSPDHTWEPFEEYQQKYNSQLWKKYEAEAEAAGHEGIDFFVLNAFVESIKRKTQTPIDVYDAAAWSVISPLSEQSIAQGGDAVEFPDFTDGKWMTNKRIFEPEKMDY